MELSSNMNTLPYKSTLQPQAPLSSTPVSRTDTHPSTTSVHCSLLEVQSRQWAYRITHLLWISYGLSFIILVFSLIDIFLHTHCVWLFSFLATVSALSIIHSVALYGRIMISKPEEQLAFFLVPSASIPRDKHSPKSSTGSSSGDSTGHGPPSGGGAITRFLQFSTWSLIWPMWVTTSIIVLISSTTFGSSNGHLPKVPLIMVYIMCTLSWVEMGVVFFMGWLIFRAGRDINELNIGKKSTMADGAI